MRLFLFSILLSFFLFSSCTFHGPRDKNVVALTFDDGPGLYTNQFLDLLQEKNVSATFFVQGYRAQAQAKTIQRMLDEGHQIGIHTWNHSMELFSSPSAVLDDIRRTQSVLPINTSLFRPSYGLLSPFAFSSIKKAGFEVIMWDLNSYDYHAHSSDEIVSRVVSKVRPGSLILFHDGINQSSLTLEALPRIIDYLQAHDFELVTVKQLISS